MSSPGRRDDEVLRARPMLREAEARAARSVASHLSATRHTPVRSDTRRRDNTHYQCRRTSSPAGYHTPSTARCTGPRDRRCSRCHSRSGRRCTCGEADRFPRNVPSRIARASPSAFANGIPVPQRRSRRGTHRRPRRSARSPWWRLTSRSATWPRSRPPKCRDSPPIAAERTSRRARSTQPQGHLPKEDQHRRYLRVRFACSWLLPVGIAELRESRRDPFPQFSS